MDKVVIPNIDGQAAIVVLVPIAPIALAFNGNNYIYNSRTIKDAFPLPRIEETIDALNGVQYFSSPDLRSRYWQVENSFYGWPIKVVMSSIPCLLD